MPLETTLTRAGLRALLKLPAPVLHLLARRLPGRAGGRTLAPEPHLLFALLARQPQPDLATLTAAQSRAASDAMSALVGSRGPAVRRVRDLDVPGGGGPLPARLFEPRGAVEAGPLLVYFHGGGFVDGSLRAVDPLCRKLAARSRVRLLAVEYRKAPEHPFPAAVDDAFAAYSWARDRARALGADPARVAVGGDSAGANLATVVARLVRDAGGPPPALQVLVYPMTDASRRAPSFATYGRGYGLTAARYEWFLDQVSTPAQRTDPRLSPLLAADLAGLPPALVVTAGFDVLHDEGAAYARRLREAGVPVEERCAATLFHGFAKLWELVPDAAREVDRLADSVGARLHRGA